MKVFKIFMKNEIDEILDLCGKINKININVLIFKFKNILIKHNREKLSKKMI